MKTLAFLLLTSIATHFFTENRTTVLDCSKFKKGIFYFRGDQDTSLYRVERNDSIQKETLLRTGDYITLKIAWPGPCDYDLSFISQHIFKTDSINTSFQGMKLSTTIKRIQGDSCFIEARFPNIEQVFKGVLYIAR